MRFMRYIIMMLAIVLAGMFVYNLFLPDSYSVTRSITIAAPASVVYEQVADLKKYEKWSPWFEGDETIEKEWGETTRGQGASFVWKSTEHGEGSFEVVEAVEPSKVVSKLDFGGQGQARAQWTFDEEAGSTKVTWLFDGETSGVFAGYMALMIETMVGPQFEHGLKTLQKVVESTPVAEGAAELPAEEG